MKRRMNGSIRFIAIVAGLGAFLQAKAGAQEPTAEAQSLTSITGEQGAHPMPLPARAAAKLQPEVSPTSGTPALIYHGGPVMTSATSYAIFWAPPTLQNGQAASLPASYQNIQTALLSTYPGHSIDNNNTQYYMTSGFGFFRFTNFVQNSGSFGGSYVDTAPYPGSGCSDPVTPGNCLSDAQIQAEVQKVMALKGWTGGLNHIFFVYTASGEGSCAGFGCAYTDYCAYHGYFTSGSTTVLYGNEPYAAAGFCQAGSSPNGDPAGDAAASITSHELTESITDPELNAWYSAGGDEIGDLCAWNYGVNTWDSGKANEYWPISFSNIILFGHFPISFFELQQEYDNHTASCVQVGP
ncbi:MAG: hypothetical protein JOY54_12870 [Acidobacteriaceae bacterium]|nr:hypothetical protein [Acidobacteriaceae bacterium]